MVELYLLISSIQLFKCNFFLQLGVEPTSFKKGDKCEWRILATHGEKIILNITTLDIPASSNCNLDYLEVLV